MAKNKHKFFTSVFLAALTICGAYVVCPAQDIEKSIQSEDLMKKRPVAKLSVQAGRTSASRNAAGTRSSRQKKRYYRTVRSQKKRTMVKPVKAAPIKMEDALLGFTVWKVRPATEKDAAKELLEEERDGKLQNSEYTLERMLTETPLVAGERIRLSIESLSHRGYLYVVERELYSDGSYSVPKLIYPTLRTRNRNNPVSAGNLVFVPEGARHFRVAPAQTVKKQVAEVLTVIISPTVLVDDSFLQTRAIDLPAEQFAGWLDRWEVDTTLLEQIDGAGQTITLVEQSAGRDAAKGLTEESSVLTQDDAVPQSIFRSKIKSGEPVLVNVYLSFKAN